MQDSQKLLFAKVCHLIISNGSGVIGSLKPSFFCFCVSSHDIDAEPYGELRRSLMCTSKESSRHILLTHSDVHVENCDGSVQNVSGLVAFPGNSEENFAAKNFVKLVC